MKIAYFDCMSGISGDMTLGALVDAGVSLDEIQAGIDSLGLPQCQLTSQEVKRHGFRATKVDVQHDEQHAHRHLHHITEMIDGSDLSTAEKELAKRIFTRLGEAEAHVHGTSLRKVHFHEVGAVDSIADIVGSAIGFVRLEVDRVIASAVPTGTGSIEIAHGRVRLPAPATAELLKGVPLEASEVQAELTTPTGAAIVTTLANAFGSLPAMQVDRISYGAGTRDLEQQANVLRLILGHTEAGASDENLSDEIWVLETNLDDVSPELIGHCASRLAEAGALDVYTTAIQMKKNRPAVKLTVLCNNSRISEMEAVIFRETATLGIRRWKANRHKLPREPRSVATVWGEIAGKLTILADGTRCWSPEYESCRDAAIRHGVALQEVYAAARRAFEP